MRILEQGCNPHSMLWRLENSLRHQLSLHRGSLGGTHGASFVWQALCLPTQLTGLKILRTNFLGIVSGVSHYVI